MLEQEEALMRENEEAQRLEDEAERHKMREEEEALQRENEEAMRDFELSQNLQGAAENIDMDAAKDVPRFNGGGVSDEGTLEAAAMDLDGDGGPGADKDGSALKRESRPRKREVLGH